MKYYTWRALALLWSALLLLSSIASPALASSGSPVSLLLDQTTTYTTANESASMVFNITFRVDANSLVNIVPCQGVISWLQIPHTQNLTATTTRTVALTGVVAPESRFSGTGDLYND